MGFYVLCLRHDIPVWQHIGQSTTATSDLTSDVKANKQANKQSSVLSIKKLLYETFHRICYINFGSENIFDRMNGSTRPKIKGDNSEWVFSQNQLQ